MQSKKDLAFELQNVISQLKRTKLPQHGHCNLKGAERHILLLISNLKDGDPVTTSEIASKIGVTLAAVTHQINALEKEGLIKRLQDKSDRRIIFIELTRKGSQQVVKLRNEFTKRIQKLSEFLGEKDTRSLIRIIKRLADFPEFTSK